MEEMKVEKEEESTHVNILPSETVGQVLRKLSVVDRLQCEGVNRRWKSIVLDLGWTETKKLSYDIVFKRATDSQKKKFKIESFVALFRRVSASLTELDLKGFPACSIYSVKPKSNIFHWLDLLPKLAKLDISGIDFRSVFEFLPSTLLELHSTGHFDEQNMTALSEKCPHLESIHFNRNAGSKLSVSVVKAFFGRCQNLKTINFAGDFIQKVENVSLTSLGQLHQLEDLHLKEVAAFDDAALTAVATGCPRLKSLKIENISVSEEAIRELDQHPNLVDFELKSHPELDENIQKATNERWKLKKFNYLRSRTPDVEFILREMLNEIISVLGSVSSASIDDLVQRGYLPLLIKSLSSTNVELRFETVALLSRITGKISLKTDAVVEAGAVPELLKLLGSESEDICKQSLLAMGNIVGDSPEFGEHCIRAGIIELLVEMLETGKSIEILQYVAEIFKNICIWRTPPLPMDNVVAILPILEKLIQNSNIIVLEKTIWTLSYIADCGNERIQLIVELGVVPRLVSLLDHSDEDVQLAAVVAVGSIALGTDEQKQLLLDLGALKMLPALISLEEDDIVEESVRFLANFACSEKWVQVLLDTGLVPVVIQALARSGDEYLRDAAAKALSNIAKFGRSEHIHYLVDFGVISPFCKLLTDYNNDISENILDGLKNILEKSDTRTGEVCDKMKRFKGYNKIKNLQNHRNENIKKVAGEIIEKYFPSNEEQNQTLNNKEMEIEKI